MHIRRMLDTLGLVALLATSYVHPVRADVSVAAGTCPFAGGCLAITGEISVADVEAVIPMVEKAAKAGLRMSFDLDSRGGDVVAAMDIGRLMRRVRGIAVGGRDSMCLSACVFLLAGATERIPPGTVGIHRPFSARTGTKTFEAADQEYRALQSQIRSYFKTMNVSDALYEAIVRVPPEQIRVLSDIELRDFGLKGLDPAEQEVQDSLEASRYRITKAEYLRRKVLVERSCNDLLQSEQFDAYHLCDEQVKKTGLSPK
jgi:hypothetical protein